MVSDPRIAHGRRHPFLTSLRGMALVKYLTLRFAAVADAETSFTVPKLTFASNRLIDQSKARNKGDTCEVWGSTRESNSILAI